MYKHIHVPDCSQYKYVESILRYPAAVYSQCIINHVHIEVLLSIQNKLSFDFSVLFNYRVAILHKLPSHQYCQVE